MGAFPIFVYYLRVAWFGKVHFYFLMGMFYLMFSKISSLPSSFSFPNKTSFVILNLILKIKHFLSRAEKQPEIFVLIAVLLTLQVTQNTNCLYYSSPFHSLVFSSSLLGDPSLLPKLSLPHSSRIADYMQKKQQPNKLNQRMKILLKNHY